MRDHNTDQYHDMIHLPHHTSPTRPRMSLSDRAAQFSPFAALTGYEAAIKETGRLTEAWVELDEYEKSVINEKIQLIVEQLAMKQAPKVTITYFIPDQNEQKDGGAYLTMSGIVKKIDLYENVLVMENRERILLERVVRIESAATI